MSNAEKIEEMCRRVGLPIRTGSHIYTKALIRAVRFGQNSADMVLVAKAIKYVAENREHLRPQWRIL